MTAPKLGTNVSSLVESPRDWATLRPVQAGAGRLGAASLSPDGGISPWGGPAAKLTAPTLGIACPRCPPRGRVSPWGGPAAK